ncbi:unnamed protein product [Cuscuta campestris]|uniref:Uncharacterized protein n=1 Tax=Cuscuta campestris TaxID=132261 RepID=A0A484NIW7_9ASTE|nr:unnamed protein product [Cuscuta campestris]
MGDYLNKLLSRLNLRYSFTGIFPITHRGGGDDLHRRQGSSGEKAGGVASIFSGETVGSPASLLYSGENSSKGV